MAFTIRVLLRRPPPSFPLACTWANKACNWKGSSLLHSGKIFFPEETCPLMMVKRSVFATSTTSLFPLRLRLAPCHIAPSVLFCSQSESKNSSDASMQQEVIFSVPLEGKSYQCIQAFLVEEGAVGLIVLNRPKLLNALSDAVMHEVVDALQSFDNMQKVGAMIITGSGKAFAAGADIKEMKDKHLVDIYTSAFPAKWNDVARIQKPIIAAVNGYALGGGCELAMMCDIVLAGESAIFGQPEINLGTIPGMGGTQRLSREVGKSRAMEMILTGKYYLDAQEACRRGLASRVICGDNEKLLNEAIIIGNIISKKSRPAIIMAKAAVHAAYENGLHEGIEKERALFAATFALQDQKEGMSAFVEKREADFKHK